MSVAAILEQLAANAGRTQRARGALYGNLIADASQIPGQILNDRERQRLFDEQRVRVAAQDARAVAADARATADQARQDQGAAAAERRQAALQRGIAAGFADDPHTFNLDKGVASVIADGMPDLAVTLRDVHQKFAPPAPKPFVSRDPTHDLIDPNVAPGEAPRVVLPGTPKPPAPPPVGSVHDTPQGLVRIGPDNTVTPVIGPDGRQVKGYHPPLNQGGPANAVDNVKEAVAGMKDGTLPPQMPGRASKDYTAILAEARRQGFDLGKANLDWNATQKHIATMNGSQQLRLNQAINALPEMLDSVEALASQWKGGRFPILNKANLALAKGGAYGQDVASVATQLDAQIADVVADLGNVYMGGNSPTDHALGLAGKSLKGEWSEKVLKDMVALAKKNVVIRRNSIAHTGVAGASPDNPYAPPPPSSGVPQEGDVKPITLPGYPAGAEQTYRNGKWVRTK